MTVTNNLGRAFVALLSIMALRPVNEAAACPQELSIYEDSVGNAITFLPPHETQAAEQEFTLRLGQTALQGVVMWSKEPDHRLIVEVKGILGKRGAPHAEALLLPDFSRYAMEHPFKTPLAGPPKVDDVFRMKACQE